MRTWLDPSRTTWSKDLQSILKPYEGELECYPVPKEVGKVGNNSPDFIVPVNSKENKSNIANFFANAKKKELESPEIKDEKHAEYSGSLAAHGVKRERTPDMLDVKQESQKQKVQRTSTTPSPAKAKTRSATHNSPMKKSGTSKPTDGSQRITSFFKK